MTLNEIMRAAEARLDAAGDIDAEADVRWLMCECLGIKPSGLRFASAPDKAACAL